MISRVETTIVEPAATQEKDPRPADAEQERRVQERVREALANLTKLYPPVPLS